MKPSNYTTFVATVAAVALIASGASANDEQKKGKAHETAAEVSAGGTLNTGNTESWQVGVGNRFRLLRGHHAFEEAMTFNYGQADISGDGVDEFQDTVRNFNIKARYDYLFRERDSVFIGGSFRWDTFAGLDARIQGNIGYARALYKAENHRFWGELGYDLTYDNLHPDPLLDAAGNQLPGDDVVHAGRVFLGYDNRISKSVSFLSGAEALVNVEDPEDTRVNWDNALRASLVGQLQLEVKFSLKFDNVPVPGAENLDTTTQLNLIYSLL